MATDRAKFILTWMTVGADQDDFKAPKGEKTFEGSFCNDTTVVLQWNQMMHVLVMKPTICLLHGSQVVAVSFGTTKSKLSS